MAATTTAGAAAAGGTPVEEDKESSGITIEILQQHFHQPLMTVAEELGVSLTMIKRLCRKLGMPRWPFRQIDSINKAMEDLQDQLEGARTEADRARYMKALEDAQKKKQLITRGAAAGVDPNVRNALYLADTADVSEEDIFGNPELMPKLSAALKTITKRKRVKGKPLVDLIATVQRDGSLPACVQASNGSAATTPSSSARAAAAKKTGAGAATAPAAAAAAAKSAASRRQIRPPAIVDAIETSNEEYEANIEHAYGSVHQPESSSSSATTSVSPALSSLGNSAHSSVDEYAAHGWGHNNASVQQQQYGRHSQGGTPAAAPAATSARGAGSGGGNHADALRGGRVNGDGYLQDSLDSPTSSCATIIAANSPGGGEHRFSPGGSLSGGFSPAVGAGAGNNSATNGVQLAQPPSYAAQSAGSAGNGVGTGQHWAGQRQPSPAAGQLQQQQQQQQQRQQRQQRQQHKRPSIASSVASTDVESLDTSHLLDFDDDDDDEAMLYGGPGYAVPGGDVGGVPSTGGGVGGGTTGTRVSPEDLQELEDALLVDTFVGVMDELEGEDIPMTFPKLEGSDNMSFPGLLGASKPLQRSGAQPTVAGAGAGIPRGTPRSTGTTKSPRVQMFGGRGVSPSHAGSASPVGATATPSSSAGGPPRPGPRGSGRPRSSQVPPRPYTPSRGGLFLAHGLRGENSPRVGSSPRPPTPGTPGTHATTPNGRRRGDEAFPSERFGLPSPNDPHGTNALLGGPSPKSRRVGAKGYSERFPGSPQAGLSPLVGFPPQSPLGASNVLTTCSPLGGSERSYFPAPAASAAAALADSSSRGHRRSNSNGLSTKQARGSAPRHGGGGDGGLDTGGGGAGTSGGGVAGSTGMSSGFQASSNTTTSTGTNWGKKSSWGLTLGEIQQQNARPQSPLAAIPGKGQQQRLSQQQLQRKHGVVRRRHSAPIPNPPAGGAVEWASEDFVGAGAGASSSSSSPSAAVPVNGEFHAQANNKQSLEGLGGGGGGSGNVLDSFSAQFLGTTTGMGGAAKWGGVGAPAPAPAQVSDGDGAWWQQPQQQQLQPGAGAMVLGTSAAATSTTVDVANSCKFDSSFDPAIDGDLDAHGLTSTLTSSLSAVDL
eukprot:g6805.t1